MKKILYIVSFVLVCSCSRNVNVTQTTFLTRTGKTVIYTTAMVNGKTTITRDTL